MLYYCPTQMPAFLGSTSCCWRLRRAIIEHIALSLVFVILLYISRTMTSKVDFLQFQGHLPIFEVKAQNVGNGNTHEL